MRNSLTNPLSGGRPQMATAPTRKQSGGRRASRRASPPRWSISRVCGGMDHRAGAQKQQRLEEGVIPDVQEGPAIPARPSPAGRATGRAAARPSPITMMPMFSMLW